MSDAVLWPGISRYLSTQQVSTMVSFGLYWMYCQDSVEETSLSKAKAVQSCIQRICSEPPTAEDWERLPLEHQHAILSAFRAISSSETMLREAVGFFKRTNHYTQIKHTYAQAVNTILADDAVSTPCEQGEIGHFIVLRSGIVKFSLFYHEIKKLESEERIVVQEQAAKETITLLEGTPYSRIQLAYMAMAIATDTDESLEAPVKSKYIASLDDLDEPETSVRALPVMTDELRAALKEMAWNALDPKYVLPEMSTYCAALFTKIFSETHRNAKEEAERAIVASTGNTFLSNYYQERINDSLLITNDQHSIPQVKEELIAQVANVSHTAQIGIFYYQNTFFFSEDVFLVSVFSYEIAGTINDASNRQRFDRKKLRSVMSQYFPETNVYDDIRTLILALDNHSDAEFLPAVIESVRRRPYLETLLDLPIPTLERCKPVLMRVVRDAKHTTLQTAYTRSQVFQRFSPQGLIDYLQVSLEKATPLYVNVLGKITQVSILDALKACVSSNPVYASLNPQEIALYATPDEAYGLLHKVASLLSDKKEDTHTSFDTLFAILSSLRKTGCASEKDIVLFRSILPQKLMRLLTDKITAFEGLQERNTYKTTVLTVLTGLQRMVQSSLSEKECLCSEDINLLSVADQAILSNIALPVGWLMKDKSGELLYTLEAQKALSLAKSFVHEKYNQLVDLGDFQTDLLVGDIRWITLAGLFLQRNMLAAKPFLAHDAAIPPFSPLALKKWSLFVLENATQDLITALHNHPLLTLLAKKDIVAVTRQVIESLSVVSTEWPKEINRIQESLRTTTPHLLVVWDTVFYNEVDFWTAIFERRLTKARSMRDLSSILSEMLPDGSLDVTDTLEDQDAYTESEMVFVPFLNSDIPTFLHIAGKILKDSPSEIDMGWVYEKTRTFRPFLLLLKHLFRIHGFILTPESIAFLQNRLSKPEESHDLRVNVLPEGVVSFRMGIDPRMLEIDRLASAPPIYYSSTYCLSEGEIIAAYLNNLLNPQESYPYEAAFSEVDWFKLFSWGSLEAIRQIVSQVLCAPFPEFPEKYPLSTGLGYKDSWRQILEIMNAFLEMVHEHPERLLELFRSCFPKNPEEQPERAWLDHALAVMAMMIFWSRHKKLSREDQLIYALSGLWHDLGMIDFGGALTPSRASLKENNLWFNEYLTHQKVGADLFTAAWERWFPQHDGVHRHKKSICDVILYHHVKPRNSTENAIIQAIDEMPAICYMANSVADATTSVMYIHLKGAGFETILEKMLANLLRSDGGKFHIPVKIRELFPAFCALIKNIVLQK